MNTKTNEQILNDYYNCIRREDIFIKILDRESVYWAVTRIKQWKNNRNAELLKNTGLNAVNDWLINLNNQLAKLMHEILSELKMVLDWKENKIPIENSNLEIRLRERLKHLSELPIGIKMNYDADKILALEMQNYCLNGFDLMIDFITTGLLVNIKELPSFYLIQEVITNIENSVNFEKIKFITETRKAEQPQQPETSKPCFKPGSIDDVITTLNTFFDASQHIELRRIIETGSNTTDKLLFKDSGNRLSDYFKTLFERDIITGCYKTDLIKWIVKNFKYIHKKTHKEFIPKTVEKTISGNLQPCKNPIA